MLLRSFKRGNIAIRLHVHDAFEETKHPRSKQGSNAGQFVKKGESGVGSKSNETVQRSGSSGQHSQEQSKPDTRGSSGRSGGNGVRSDGLNVRATHQAAGDEHKTNFHEIEVTPQSARQYNDYITAAKNSSKYGAAVHVYPAEDYSKMRLFLTPDGSAGFALKGDDIISAFKGSNGPTGAARSMLDVAVKQGGKRLDCFDTVLPAMYNQSGFRAVARMPFNDEFKPDDWDYDTFGKYNKGRPDVVFMVYDPGNNKPYTSGDGETISDYDDGEKYQKRALGGKTKDMFIQLFKIRDHRVFLHVHDAFNPSEHPHAGKGSSKGGQFVAKGSGGGTAGPSTQTKAKVVTTKIPIKRKTPRVARGQATAGFQPLEKSEGGGFTLPGGKSLPKHIAALGRIPPAWTKVRYNPDPNGNLQVVGCDAKGKQQPLYSEKHKSSQAAGKFSRIQRLEPKFPSIMAKNTKMWTDKNPRTRDSSVALAVVMHTGMRPGSEADTKADYKSYGASTLEGRHIIAENGKTLVRFVSGKNKGKEIDMEVDDPALAQELHRRAKEAGPDGQLFPNTHERHLLTHAKSLAGAGFKTKDFRTLLGTTMAGSLVKNMPVPTTPAEYKKFVKEVATKVSQKLGNTPVIAQKDYISPHIFADWRLASGA